MEFVLRFTLSHPGLSTTIVGTSNPVHLASNIGVAEKGPLPADLYEEAKKRLPLPEPVSQDQQAATYHWAAVASPASGQVTLNCENRYRLNVRTLTAWQIPAVAGEC
jgi:hypothetical protein